MEADSCVNHVNQAEVSELHSNYADIFQQKPSPKVLLAVFTKGLVLKVFLYKLGTVNTTSTSKCTYTSHPQTSFMLV